MSPARRVRRLRRLVSLVGLGLTAAAIAQEMSRPEAERSWNGRVLSIVPYDFRPPTWERIRRAYWNTEDPRLFTDRVFGVGWSVNLYRASTLLEQGFHMLMGSSALTSRQRSPGRRRRSA